MSFEWDEAKSAANIEKHGVSFARASRIFDEPVVTFVDDRLDYGEKREVSIGQIGGILFLVVVHTTRGNNTRIISARRASSAERKRYETAIQNGTER